jgi:hypothetical protein
MPTNKSSLLTSDHPKARRANEIFRAQYDKARLDLPAGQRLNESPIFASRLLELISACAAAEPDYSVARAVLGDDFVSPEEIMRLRPEVAYSPKQLLELGASVPQRHVLEQLKERGMVLVPGPHRKLSLVQIGTIRSNHFDRKVHPFFGYYADDKQYPYTQFASPGWLAMQKTALQGSEKRTWRQQLALLRREERVLNIAEYAWIMSSVFDVRSVELPTKCMIRTSTMYDRWNGQVYIWGLGEKGGIGYNFGWNQNEFDGLGISAGLRL